MFHHRITPKTSSGSLAERIMNALLWPVSILSYVMVLLGALNVIVWLLQVLQVRLCGTLSSGPCIMR